MDGGSYERCLAREGQCVQQPSAHCLVQSSYGDIAASGRSDGLLRTPAFDVMFLDTTYFTLPLISGAKAVLDRAEL